MSVSREHIIAWIQCFAAGVAENKDYLTQLDAAIGDADHGANLDRGMQAVLARLPGVADKDVGAILKAVGMTLVSTIGGASGPLYGTFFLQTATAATNKDELAFADWLTALQAGVDGVIARGKAAPGDKTMVDALAPALAAFRAAQAAGASGAAAMEAAARAAEEGAAATIPLVARKGRASYLGDRSAGHQDPGATSAALLVRALAQVLGAEY